MSHIHVTSPSLLLGTVTSPALVTISPLILDTFSSPMHVAISSSVIILEACSTTCSVIRSLHFLFTSSNTAMRSSLLFTSYGASTHDATDSRNMETVMLRPTELELLPDTTCLVLLPSLWSFNNSVMQARAWSWVTRLSWIRPPWS